MNLLKTYIKQFLSGNINFSRNFLVAVLVLASGYILFNHLGTNPLSTDGYYYANCSKLMVQNNDFVTIWYDNAPSFTSCKGIFFYWINAVSGIVCGFDSFSMRLPQALLGFVCIMFLFFFLEKKYDYKFAFISSIILLLTQQFLYNSRACTTDGDFAVLFTFAAVTFYIAITDEKPLYYYFFGFFFAFSILIRQTLGLFILPVIVVYVFSTPLLRKKVFFNKHFYLSIIAALLIILPWYMLAYNMYGDFFLKQYFSTSYKVLTGIDVAAQFKGARWWTYLNILVSNYQPWLIFLLIGAYIKIKQMIKSNMSSAASFEKFALIWAFVPLILLQLMRGYQYHFIVMLYIPFAIISSWGIIHIFRNKNLIISYLTVIISVFVFACMFLNLLPKTLDNRHHINTVNLIPAMSEVKGQIYTIDEHTFYSNIFLFYTNRNVMPVSNENFHRMLASKNKYYFVLSRNSFANEVYGKYAVNVMAEVKDSVLFSNIF